MNTKPNNTRDSSTMSTLASIGYLSFNFVSTIAVTFINKACFTRIDFGFPAALCNIHYVTTWIGIEIMRQLGMFDVLPNAPSPRADWQFAVLVLVVGTVTPLNNTSLKLNSVAFYQFFKLLVTPAVVLLEYLLDRKVLSMPRALALIAVCIFVLITTGGDLDFNVVGTMCATIWLPLAATYKVQWGRVQRQHCCSTPALMHAVLPYAIVVQTVVMPIVDPPGLLSYNWSTDAAFWITLSGVAAFLVNLSGFLVMGHLGALAHVLLGQLKTSVICLGAYYLFGAKYTATQLWGAAGAVASIFAYTHVTTNEKKRQLDAPPSQGSDATVLPLLEKKNSDA